MECRALPAMPGQRAPQVQLGHRAQRDRQEVQAALVLRVKPVLQEWQEMQEPQVLPDRRVPQDNQVPLDSWGPPDPQEHQVQMEPLVPLEVLVRAACKDQREPLVEQEPRVHKVLMAHKDHKGQLEALDPLDRQAYPAPQVLLDHQEPQGLRVHLEYKDQ